MVRQSRKSSIEAIMDDPWYQGALETMTVAFVEIDADDDELKP